MINVISKRAGHFDSKRQADRPGTATLRGLLRGRVDTLAAILHDVRRELREREEVSRQILGTLDDDYTYAKSELLALQTATVGSNAAHSARWRQLEYRLVRLQQERRLELAQRWRDQAVLSRELRSWFKEYWKEQQWNRLVHSQLNAKR